MTEKSYLQRRLEMKLGIKTSTDASASAKGAKIDDPGKKVQTNAKAPTARKTPAKPSKPAGKPGKYKRMKTATKKRARQNLKYTKVKKKFLQDHPTCMAQLEGCTGVATDLHHIGGRTGENLLKVEDFAALCRNCHDIIHKKMSAEQAKKIGMKK
jgi:5-methylcytosine-specific restriction endonuclease McrA